MHSHRRSRGKIFFEAFCAVCVGVSFVGAWTQTGAWAFLGPAFICTLFGLYWALDMFGSDVPAVAKAVAAPAPVRLADPEPVADRDSAVMPEIRIERFEPPAAALPEPVAAFVEEPELHTDAVPFVSEPAPVAEPAPRKAKKPRAAKKAAEPVIQQVVEPARVLDEPAHDEPQNEPHIEQLFDPKPFARQARPAFGKRPRGPGPRPLPA
jgi:hypothetical protein